MPFGILTLFTDETRVFGSRRQYRTSRGLTRLNTEGEWLVTIA
jgi:hypothetical protein